jgi:hypothetical protein
VTRTEALHWLWPTQPRHPQHASLRECLRRFWLVLGVLLALGFFLFACWYSATEAWRPRESDGTVIVVRCGDQLADCDKEG